MFEVVCPQMTQMDADTGPEENAKAQRRKGAEESFLRLGCCPEWSGGKAGDLTITDTGEKPDRFERQRSSRSDFPSVDAPPVRRSRLGLPYSNAIVRVPVRPNTK